MSPLISIIVPCYKQAQYLEECLQSVLAQTYSNWECIIVNDGSPDNTESIASIWTEKDKRFNYIFTENKGVSHARNLGIQNAKGFFILPLDADDKIGTTYLEKGITAFENNPALKLVYCKARYFGTIEREWTLPDFSLKNLSNDNMIFCSAIYKKADWEQIGGYDATLLKGLEDWEFWIALLKNGGAVYRIDETEFFYRIKENSRQSDLNRTNKEPLIAYITIKHAAFFIAQKGSFFSLENKIKQLEKDHYKNVTNKKKALKIFLKAFFGIDYFKKN